jgi:hypothetical protein
MNKPRLYQTLAAGLFLSVLEVNCTVQGLVLLSLCTWTLDFHTEGPRGEGSCPLALGSLCTSLFSQLAFGPGTFSHGSI